MAHAALARVLIATHNLPEAAQAVESGRRGLKPEALVLYGREMVGLAECDLALAQSNALAALALSESLMAQIQRAETSVFLPEALWLKGRAHQRLADRAAARAAWEEAARRARQIGLRRILWQTLLSLGKVEAQLGDAPAARARRDEAQQVIEVMAAHLNHSEQRASFLRLTTQALSAETY
jgi:hypothetical protein